MSSQDEHVEQRVPRILAITIKTRPPRTHRTSNDKTQLLQAALGRDPCLGAMIRFILLYVNDASAHLKKQVRQSKHKPNLTFVFSSITTLHCRALWFQIGTHSSLMVGLGSTHYNEEQDYADTEGVWLSFDTEHHRFSMTHPDTATVVSRDIFRINSVKIKGPCSLALSIWKGEPWCSL